MKYLSALTIAAVLGLAPNLHSEAPPAPGRTPLQTLQAMKAQNQLLLEKQAQTLLKLDELEKSAAQTKIFARRT